MGLYYNNTEKLLLPEYKWWYDAIVQDDFETMRHHLQNASKEEKYHLLNGRFDDIYEEDEDMEHIKPLGYSCLEKLNAFSLAIAYQASKQTLIELLENGADLSLQNAEGKNSVHIMVTLAFLKPSVEDYMMQAYTVIQDNLSVDKLKEVLLQEDKNGFRPLELASNYATCGLFQSILETKMVYLTKEAKQGLSSKQFFDITDYESVEGERKHRSPVILFSLLDKRAVHNKYIDTLFQCEYFNQWIRHRFRKLVGFVLIWHLLKILQFTAYVIFDGSLLEFEEEYSGLIKENETSCLNENMYFKSSSKPFVLVCVVYVLISCVAGIAIDVHEVIMSSRYWYKGNIVAYFRTIKGEKKLLYDYGRHRFIQFVINAGMLCHVIVRLLRYEYEFETSQLLSGLAHFLIVSQMAAVVVFFLQVIPRIGFYAVILQRIGSIFLWQFSTLFFIAAIPYMFAIHRLVNYGQLTCQDNFSSIYQTMYSIFLLTFNMLDLTYIEGSDEYLIVLYIIHSVFVLLIGVLLVNFLIALFTNYVGSVLDLKHIIIPVHVLFVLGITEMRVTRWSPWILRHYQDKSFVTDKKGRLYISRTVIASKDTGSLRPLNSSTTTENRTDHEGATGEHGFFDNNMNITRATRNIDTYHDFEDTFL